MNGFSEFHLQIAIGTGPKKLRETIAGHHWKVLEKLFKLTRGQAFVRKEVCLKSQISRDTTSTQQRISNGHLRCRTFRSLVRPTLAGGQMTWQMGRRV